MGSLSNELGKLLVKEIKREIFKMDLYDSGEYVNSIKYSVSGTKIEIYSDVDYSEALEYGTYERVDMSDEQHSNPIPAKKKDLPIELARKMPKGIGAFAPFRRVLYN